MSMEGYHRIQLSLPILVILGIALFPGQCLGIKCYFCDKTVKSSLVECSTSDGAWELDCKQLYGDDATGHCLTFNYEYVQKDAAGNVKSKIKAGLQHCITQKGKECFDEKLNPKTKKGGKTCYHFKEDEKNLMKELIECSLPAPDPSAPPQNTNNTADSTDIQLGSNFLGPHGYTYYYDGIEKNNKLCLCSKNLCNGNGAEGSFKVGSGLVLLAIVGIATVNAMLLQIHDC